MSVTLTQKKILAERYGQLLGGGHSGRSAAAVMALDPATIARWHRQLEEAGGDALRAFGRKPGGRPPGLKLTQEDILLLKRYRLDNKRHSLDRAVEEFLDDPAASPAAVRALAAILSRADAERARPVWPHSLRKAVRLSQTEKDLHRGPKTAQNSALKARSGDFILLGDREIPLLSGLVYQSDDMSLNQPFRYADAALGRDSVGRQTLITRDTRSLRWLQADACGRERDSYRVEDIADHMLSVVRAHGVPLAWILERGPWENNFVDGFKLEDGKSRWGALTDLFHIHHAFTSTGKAEIEGGFDYLQSLLSHKSTDIGAHRGEFEQATKLFLKARRGNEQALGYFWNIATCMDAVQEAMEQDNRRLKARQHQNGQRFSPAELWAAEHHFTALDPDLEWYFCPHKGRGTVRGGALELSAAHYPRSFRFAVHGADGMPCLDHGYPVFVAFHPGQPHQGCHVFNAAQDDRSLPGLRFKERIGLADWLPDTPRLVIGGTSEVEAKRRASAAVRKEYRSIVAPGTGPGTLRSAARDTLGNTLTVATAGAPAAPAPADRRAAAEAPPAPGRSREDLLARARRAREEAERHLDLT